MRKKKKVNAAILIIGNEILSGRTQDKNIAFLLFLGACSGGWKADFSFFSLFLNWFYKAFGVWEVENIDFSVAFVCF